VPSVVQMLSELALVAAKLKAALADGAAEAEAFARQSRTDADLAADRARPASRSAPAGLKGTGVDPCVPVVVPCIWQGG
jgi:hypothetical protein